MADLGGESEQRREPGGTVVAAVEPEHELVEVGVDVVRADAVVRPLQPGLQVGDDAIHAGCGAGVLAGLPLHRARGQRPVAVAVRESGGVAPVGI